jgi:FlaG/FlaF family flagellin (archaellin)
MIDGATLRETDRAAVTSGVTVAAMIAVSVTLAAVLGTWMLTGNPDAVGAVDAEVAMTYEDGEATVEWTQEGTASRIRVAVGTDVRIINEPGETVTITASPDQRIIVVGERSDGDAAVIARAEAGTLDADEESLFEM